jgi:RND family efflux transporter MFP subunit
MKKYFILFAILGFAAACGGPNKSSKLEKDKAKLADLKKQDADLRQKIETLQDTINSEGGKEIKTVKVVTKDIVTQPFKHYVEVQAEIYGQDNINVSPEMPGVVKSLSVTEGNTVTKGQVLATLDDAVIQQNLAEMQSQLELTKTLYEKQKNLWDQKIGTEVQYLNAKTNYESMQKRLAALQQQADMAQIKSPIDGTVDAVNIKVGESVAPGMPTITVVNTQQLKVKGNIAEAFISDIHAGDSLMIRFPDLGKEIASTATYVSHAIDPINRTFMVEVALPQNPDYHPNMIALMKIVDYSAKVATVIPINVVQSDPTGTFVFVAVQSGATMVAKKQPITVGKVNNGMAEILSGVKPGDKLITVGYEDLNNGDAVSM